MATLTEVKNRISGVKNTQKITKAMKIVAATKLYKYEKLGKTLKPYAYEIEKLLREIASYKRFDAPPRMISREAVKRVGYIIISSDRGLCGAFNSSLLKSAEAAIKEQEAKGREVALYVLGSKGLRFFERAGRKIVYSKTRTEKESKRSIALDLAAKVTQDFLNKDVDRVRVAYSQFRSVASFGYSEFLFLPTQVKGSQKTDVEPLYEDNYREVLDAMLPLYMENVLYSAILQSMASEEASRMLAMDYATENANTLIGELTLFYNRTRQAAITKEISEIVGGSEALKK